MSALMKLLPVAAVGVAGVAGFTGLKDNANIIDKFTVAAVKSIEMPGIAEAVAVHYIEHDTLPVKNFQEFMKENLRENKGGSKRDKTADPWGTAYVMSVADKGFKIHSAGPDKEWKTEDDLVHSYDLAGLGGISDQPYKQTGSMANKKNTPPANKKKGAQRKAPPKRASKQEIDNNVVEFQMKRAAEGSASAQYDLAMRYLKGNSVEADFDKAMDLLRQSADQDYSKAASKLKVLSDE